MLGVIFFVWFNSYLSGRKITSHSHWNVALYNYIVVKQGMDVLKVWFTFCFSCFSPCLIYHLPWLFYFYCILMWGEHDDHYTVKFGFCYSLTLANPRMLMRSYRIRHSWLFLMEMVTGVITLKRNGTLAFHKDITGNLNYNKTFSVR